MSHKQCEGQLILSDLPNQLRNEWSCSKCVCKSCLYWWSGRCPYGGCYDDLRAIENPYDKAHPDKSPRNLWSDWNKSGEQAHWCRGGSFYPSHWCWHYVRYEKQHPEEPMRDCVYKHQTRWCAKCKRIVIRRWKHCPICGQKLDWSEEND